MNNEGNFSKTLYTVLQIAATVLMVFISFWTADELGLFGKNGNVRSFYTDWVNSAGEMVSLENIRTVNPGETIRLTKKIPGSVTDEDCLCFELKNINIRLYIDEHELYSFQTRDNLSGRGYGCSFHMPGIAKTDGGHMVTMELWGIDDKYKSGAVVNMYLAPALDYVRLNVRDRFIPFLLSILIFFFGLALLIMGQRIRDKQALPFDAGALGLTALLVGIWVTLDTNVVQLLFGAVYTTRGLDKTLIFLTGYPLIAFINSYTRLRRMRYQHIAFGISIGSVFLEIILRYAAGIDMAYSFTRIALAVLVMFVALIIVLFVDNAIYSANNGLALDFKALYLGGIIFLSGCLVDAIFYLLRLNRGDSFGSFTRVGMLLFLLIMLHQLFNWWSGNQKSVERDRFVNNMLQYAVSSELPDSNIKSVIDYMGTELQARRIVIFEERGIGKFRGTYEWHKEGIEAGGVDLMYLPYEGLVDDLLKTFRANDRRLIIDDPEIYRSVNPTLYNLLKSNNVTTLVASPLESNDKLVGLFAITGAPKEKLKDASEILGLTSYFLSQLLVQREEQERLRFYSYNDSLTGALNRRAYKEYIDKGLDKASAFGFLMCDIEGLEDANNTKGYEAGDMMVKDMVGVLSDVFGIKNVYRLGGAEFAAFGFESEEGLFEADVERVKKLAGDKELRVSIGAVYCAFGTMSMTRVINRASELISEQKSQG